MALPVQDLNHVAEGLAYLTDQYKNPANVPILQGLLSVYLRRIQDLENVLWQIVNTRILANAPTGDQLTQLGNLVGQPRGAFNDTNLLAAILLRILTNKSNGLANDIINMVAAISTGGWSYWEGAHAAFGVGLWNLASPDLAQQLLTAAKPGGVYAELVYTTWADGNDFSFSSVYLSSAGEAGWGSVYDSGASGGLLASARIL